MIRAVIYIRVSSKEQVEGHSLDAQLRACRQLCEQRGYDVVAIFVDEGVSARSDRVAKRPEFARMMAAAERGAFDVVVVHKIDRFARDLRVQMECLDRLGKVRVMFVSVSEPNLDYSRPGDFLVLTMFGAMAQQYSMNLSQETKKGWDERRRKGLYCGLLPFGAMKDASGIPVPDTRPVEANGQATSNHDGLLLAFRRAAEGADDLEVAEALNAAGYRPAARNKRGVFTRESVRVILTNRFYLGELPRGKRGKDGWEQGIHQPLVPLDLWDAVQRHRATRQKTRPSLCVPRTARVYALSGLMRCAKCGGRLHIYAGADRTRVYCYSRDLLGNCDQRSALASNLEAQVEQYLGTLVIPDDYQTIVLRALRAERPEVAENESKRRELQGRLRRLRDLYELGDLTRPEYEGKRAAVRAEIDRLETGDGMARADVLSRLRGYLGHIPSAWRDATPELRNKLARTLFEEIVVDDGRVTGAVPRDEYRPFFALDERARASLGKETPPPQRAGVFEEAGSRGVEPADHPPGPPAVGEGVVASSAVIVVTVPAWPRESVTFFLYGQPQFLHCRGVCTGQTAISGDDFCCAFFYDGRPAAAGLAAALHAARETVNRRVIEARGRRTRRQPCHGSATIFAQPAGVAGCVRAGTSIPRGRAGA